VKDLTDIKELEREIPNTAREFRFDNMVLKITKKNDTYGFVIKNIENPKHHHTMIADKQPSFHYTKESDGVAPNTHQPIDYQKFQHRLVEILQDIFSTAQKVNVSDPRFANKHTLMFVSQRLFIVKKTAKKVVFDQEIEYEESLFQDIDTSENRMGFTVDENGSEECMIIVQNGDVFKIDVNRFEHDNKVLDSVYRSKINS